MKTGYIYCATCLPTGKSYFGQTVRTIEKRWKRHLCDTERGSNHKFHRAIRKYGSKNFTIEGVISVEASSLQALKAKLDFLERHFIQKYDARRNGYNMTDGGDEPPMLGRHHSIETRRRIGEAGRGRLLSEETKRKISCGNKGKKYSVETCRKISERKRGISSPLKGRKLPKKVREKMSISARGRVSPFKGRRHSEEARIKMSNTKLLRNVTLTL